MRIAKKGCIGLVLLFLLMVAIAIGWRRFVRIQTQVRIYDVNSAPSRPVAVVYGAAIFRGNHLSTILRDRMDTAIHLYENGVVAAILVSGDRQDESYDEPKAMAAYARTRGVSDKDIIVDREGKRTYDTCYRARNTFDYDSAILVTQAYHLPRALFTCNQLGLESIGVIADKRPYRGANWYSFREVAATFIALYDVIRQTPPTVTNIAPVLTGH